MRDPRHCKHGRDPRDCEACARDRGELCGRMVTVARHDLMLPIAGYLEHRPGGRGHRLPSDARSFFDIFGALRSA